MINDFRFALRMIAGHRWFSAAVIITLALGIGINTTVFTLVNAVLLKAVPVADGERLVIVSNQNLSKSNNRFPVSYPDFRDYKADNRSFEGLEATLSEQGVISENSIAPKRFRMARISLGLFDLLHVAPSLGRGFSPDEHKPGTTAVAVIGHDLWMSQYGGSSDVIGRAVRINGKPATIVGVMPANFKFPYDEDIWMPLAPTEELENRANHSLQVFGILKPGISSQAAREDLALVCSRLSKAYPDSNRDVSPAVLSFQDTYINGPIRVIMMVMMGAVGFVLLIACSNVANMMISRSIGRAREFTVRAALGASRWQLIRQLLIESIVLSCLGGLLGLGLSMIGIHFFDLSVRDTGKPYWVIISMDYVVYAYFAVISVLCGIAFGLVPALRVSRLNINTAMKDNAATGGGRQGSRLSSVLVVLQFSMTVVLLACAGMMMRSFLALQNLNEFIPAERIITAHIELPDRKGDRYAGSTAKLQFYDKLTARLGTLPGVNNVALSSYLPGAGSDRRDIEIGGKPVDNPKLRPRASYILQTPSYFSTIGLPVLLGRGFEESDGDPGKEAAIVTREFATKHWPDQPAVGNRFRFVKNDKPGPWMTVIGVCADMVQNVKDDAPPLVYLPYRQEPENSIAVLIRISGDPSSFAPLMRTAVQEIDPDMPLFRVYTLPAALDAQRWGYRVFGTLFDIFAGVGLLMAAVGIYAVIAQATARRTREIGIRMALGASAAGIMRLALAGGLRQLAIGVTLGLAGGFATSNVMHNGGIVLQVSPYDPLVFSTIAALLISIGLFACWLPARRAAALHPVDALRNE